MKLLLSFLFICIWQVSFSQMTFAEMKNIQKMDLNKFETYCISKGYEFNKTIDNGYSFGMSYTKGYESSTKYLRFYETYVIDEKNVIAYETGSSSEYLGIKAQIEASGLKLTKTHSFNGFLFKEYSDTNFEVSIVTGKDFNLNLDVYEITLKKKN